jgi:hypothetical protein
MRRKLRWLVLIGMFIMLIYLVVYVSSCFLMTDICLPQPPVLEIYMTSTSVFEHNATVEAYIRETQTASPKPPNQ